MAGTAGISRADSTEPANWSRAWAAECARRERAEGRLGGVLVALLVPAWAPFDWAMEPGQWKEFLLVRFANVAFALACMAVLAWVRGRVAVHATVSALFIGTFLLVGAIVSRADQAYPAYMFGYTVLAWGTGVILTQTPSGTLLMQGSTVAALALAHVLVGRTHEASALAAGFTTVATVAVICAASGILRFRLHRSAFRASWELDQRNRELEDAEAALTRSARELEDRVEERTAQLTASLLRLEHEVAERMAAEARAESASRAKSVFLANMSHELRTPLNAIVGYSEIIAEEIEEAEAESARRDLDRVVRSARHLLQIIDDVLDLTRVESGRLDLRIAPVDLAPVVDAAAALVEPLASARENRVRIALQADRVRTDPARLGQVLVNLLSNAARFTDHGEIEITSRDVEDPPQVEIAIRDTGGGIPPEFLPTLFERFSQADGSSTRQHGGLGLGLAISRELLTAMGGTISAESQLGRGSTFRIRLPAA